MPDRAPHTIGVIMDGNRRWARERGLPTLEGHRIGIDKLKELSEWARDAGIKEVVVYAFSTENWNRSSEEVAYLMHLFEEFFEGGVDQFVEQGVRLRFLGALERMNEKLQALMHTAEERTAHGTRGTFALAVSYGGRAEIVAAVNRLLKEGKSNVDEKLFSQALWSAGIADPDLIIRTGGEQRLSNFLPWQSVYSELFFTKTKWPDFSKEEFERILAQYARRERRRGA